MPANRDWGVQPNSLTLPPFAGPNDDAIILDPAPAGCLGSRYAAVIVWRQNPPSFRGQFYIGVVRSSLIISATTTMVECGFMLNDVDTGVCWINVTGRWQSDFDPIGGNSFTQLIGNLQTVGGPAPNPFVFGLSGADVDFQINGVSQGRGLKAHVESSASNAGGVAEGVVLTTSSMVFTAGRAYQMRWMGQLVSSAAQTSTVRIRKTDVVGQILASWSEGVVAGTLTRSRHYEAYVINTSGADITADVCLTLQCSVGTLTQSGVTTNIRRLVVEDCGAATDWPLAIAIV